MSLIRFKYQSKRLVRKQKTKYIKKLTKCVTKREVKMAGYWPRSIFLRFMDRNEVEVHKNAKKNEANIQPS